MMSVEHTFCYFDISIGGLPAGRLTFELFDDVVPKTTANFKHLCIGDKTSPSGTKLAYAGSGFHRCIKGFMLQGGDFTRHNGTGGESIYGEKFEDENFALKHEKPMLLSMANAGPGTNGSQFFITTVPTPHLDGKHVVFGRVASNRGLVRRIEDLPTTSDKPHEDVKITAAGVLSEEEVKAAEEERKKGKEGKGDVYEEFPADEEGIDVDKPEETLEVGKKLKDIGTGEFKAGNFSAALEKYQKALRYLDQNPVLPNDAPSDLVEGYRSTRLPLLTNAALAALKTSPAQPQVAVNLTTRALNLEDLSPADKGKALYRRGLARTLLKDEDEAEKDLKEALEAVPGDAGVIKALKDVEVKRKARKDKERAVYSKMFG